MTSDFEKYIYNLHLKTTRQHNNQPYKIRKNFDDLADKDFICLKKVCHFFNKHSEISPATFFLSSYKVHTDEKYLDLCYFNTLKAVKAYTIFNNNISNSEPESEKQLEFTKKSLLFIYNFCKINNIKICDYLSHRTNNIFTFLLHLKNRDVNLYSLMGFDNLHSFFSLTDTEVISFMFEDRFDEKVSIIKIKYLNSIKCRNLVTTGLVRLENNLENTLNSIN